MVNVYWRCRYCKEQFCREHGEKRLGRNRYVDSYALNHFIVNQCRKRYTAEEIAIAKEHFLAKTGRAALLEKCKPCNDLIKGRRDRLRAMRNVI